MPLHEYFAIPGRHPELSLAELQTVSHRDHLEFTFSKNSLFPILFSSSQPAQLSELLPRLGGIIKMGAVIARLPVTSSHMDAITAWLTADRVLDHLPPHDRRRSWGFSIYSTQQGSSPVRLLRTLSRHGMSIKKTLEQRGTKTQFLTSRAPDLSSVIVTKEHLIDRGADFCLILLPKEVVVGRTQAVQNFKEYSRRDYGRPNRDAHSGMLPPKLAQMMINLSACPLNETFLDPFCGSGTILQEAALMGYQKMMGSDLSPKAIEDSQKNLSWVLREQQIDPDIQLFQSDVVDLIQNISPKSVHAIVTEPFLGPPVKGRINTTNAQKIRDKLEHLYQDSLGVFLTLLKPHGRIVMVIPTFVVDNRKIEIGIPKILPRGLAIQKIYHYARPDQYVHRDILCATKVG